MVITSRDKRIYITWEHWNILKDIKKDTHKKTVDEVIGNLILDAKNKIIVSPETKDKLVNIMEKSNKSSIEEVIKMFIA